MSVETQSPQQQTEAMHGLQPVDFDVSAQQWMAEFDQKHIDTVVQMTDTEGNVGEWKLNDAVKQINRDDNGAEISRTPVVEMVNATGDTFRMPVADFLQSQPQAEPTSANRLVGTFGDVVEVRVSGEVALPATSKLVGSLATVGALGRVEMPSVALAESGPKPEKPASEWESMIFAPIDTAEEESAEPSFDYSDLLSADGSNNLTVEGAAVKKGRDVNGRENIDDWTRGGAANTISGIMMNDKDVQGIIGRYMPEAQSIVEKYGKVAYDAPNFEEAKEQIAKICDVVRTNADARLELGRLFLGRANQLANEGKLAPRLKANGQKAGVIPGYPKGTTSREYASLLAISMIDGSFDNRRETDEIETNEKGQVIRGQHRDAAFQILAN